MRLNHTTWLVNCLLCACRSGTAYWLAMGTALPSPQWNSTGSPSSAVRFQSLTSFGWVPCWLTSCLTYLASCSVSCGNDALDLDVSYELVSTAHYSSYWVHYTTSHDAQKGEV